MRVPKYLSPTSLTRWTESRDTFYLTYLADNRPPREPQTQPMAVGSSFDAYVKSYYHELLYGKTPEYELRTLFEIQVEEHNRDEAWVAGKECFELYKHTGALADIFKELKQAKNDPKFEVTIEDTIGGVPLLGKPDLYFINKEGVPVILDWKVNGYYSKHNTSPKKGYCKLRPGGKVHKDCHLMKVHGMMINIAFSLEEIDGTWATQLATYAWLCGADVGSDFVVALDQIVGNPGKQRIAEHRYLINHDFQKDTLKRFQELWKIIKSGHIFTEYSEAESKKKCETLDCFYKLHESENVHFKLIGK